MGWKQNVSTPETRREDQKEEIALMPIRITLEWNLPDPNHTLC